eukprot:3873805-Amphidinium_carterae.1
MSLALIEKQMSHSFPHRFPNLKELTAGKASLFKGLLWGLILQNELLDFSKGILSDSLVTMFSTMTAFDIPVIGLTPLSARGGVSTP